MFYPVDPYNPIPLSYRHQRLPLRTLTEAFEKRDIAILEKKDFGYAYLFLDTMCFTGKPPHHAHTSFSSMIS